MTRNKIIKEGNRSLYKIRSFLKFNVEKDNKPSVYCFIKGDEYSFAEGSRHGMRKHKHCNVMVDEELGEISLNNFLNLTSNKRVIEKVNPIIKELEERGVFE